MIHHLWYPQKRRSGYFEKQNHDTIEKRTMTLEQMMNLPEDRGDVFTSP
jgi:hypothetical protein